jgi:SNF2 family DNA or RNA helicase
MLIVKNKKAVVFKLRNPSRITTVIPTAVTVDHKGQELVAVPHRPDETRVLRNLGFEVPDPMPIYYEWPKVSGRHDPFEAQRHTASFLTMNSRAYCLNGMGTGKTNSTLWAYDYLRRTRQVNRMLVVCPLSTMERTWSDSIFNTFPHLDCAVLHGTRAKRLKLLEQDVHIYIINHDGIEIIADALAKRPDIDIITVDELALARNQGTDRWKTLNRICNKQTQRRVWGLTGSPTPNSPTDAWAQCRLVTPDNPLVPKYFSAFRDRVMRQITQFKWVPRQEANDIIYNMMQPAIRYSLDDCTDLPEQTFISRDVELTPEQAKAYKDMLNKLSTDVEGGQILAVNEAVKANKLVQIACGVAYDINGNQVVIPSKPRMTVLKETIEQSEGKVIVFVPFTGALQSVADELRKDWEVEIVDGSTSKTDRDRIFGSFQRGPDPHVIVANAAAMSHGLTLTAATTIVWYAPVHSNETYEQACARVRRPGQTRTTVIVHIAGSEIERKIYRRLQDKQSMQGLLLDMMKDDPENLKGAA